MIYHIYWGTSGNSGLYLHEIYQTLKSAGFSQKAFVNYYFPFDYGEKIFFKRGDIAYGSSKGRMRKIFQLVEVLKGYLIILCHSLKDKPEVINYSHVGNSYFFIPLYLKILRRFSGAKIVVTCHDVLPHSGGGKEWRYRKQIFDIADNLLVHTDTSKKELSQYFHEDERKFVKHLFPIMDLSLLAKNGLNSFSPKDFLFIGHLRQDKGIDFFMEAWEKFHAQCPDASLRVCGKRQSGVKFNERNFDNCNVEFNIHFISDEDYPNYVRAARYVVLPYLQGTNSGIISTVLSLGTNVITSDIPMFTENKLVSENDTFEVGNIDSLISVLKMKYLQKEEKAESKLDDYRKEFFVGVKNVYDYLLTK